MTAPIEDFFLTEVITATEPLPQAQDTELKDFLTSLCGEHTMRTYKDLPEGGDLVEGFAHVAETIAYTAFLAGRCYAMNRDNTILVPMDPDEASDYIAYLKSR